MQHLKLYNIVSLWVLVTLIKGKRSRICKWQNQHHRHDERDAKEYCISDILCRPVNYKSRQKTESTWQRQTRHYDLNFFFLMKTAIRSIRNFIIRKFLRILIHCISVYLKLCAWCDTPTHGPSIHIFEWIWKPQNHCAIIEDVASSQMETLEDVLALISTVIGVYAALWKCI